MKGEGSSQGSVEVRFRIKRGVSVEVRVGSELWEGQDLGYGKRESFIS